MSLKSCLPFQNNAEKLTSVKNVMVTHYLAVTTVISTQRLGFL